MKKKLIATLHMCIMLCFFQKLAFGEVKTFIQHPYPTVNNLNCTYFIDNQIGIIAGDNGEICYTSDSGASWIKKDGMTKEKLNSIDFGTPDNGWIVGKNGVMLQSNDSGQTWIYKDRYTDKELLDVFFGNERNGWAVGNNGIILYTKDSGESWEIQPVGVDKDLFSVFFVDSINGWSVGDNGIILHTKNSGKSWVIQNSNTNNPLRGIYFLNKNKGWIVGNGGICLRTIDGGNSWTIINDTIQGSYLIKVHFADSVRGVAVDIQDGIYLSSDGGFTWEKGSCNARLFSLHFIDNGNGWVTGERGRIYKTDDYGINWHSLHTGVREDLTRIRFLDSLYGWAVGNNGAILSTIDGGEKWITQESGTNKKLKDVSFSDINSGMAVGDNGTILLTEDGGETWAGLNSGISSKMNSVYLSNDDGWVSDNNGKVWYSSDKGETWSVQLKDTGSISVSIPNFIKLIFMDSNTGFAFGKAMSSKLPIGIGYKTVDGGDNWEKISSLIRPSNILSIMFTDKLNGFCIIDHGDEAAVRSTSDGGNSWTTRTQWYVSKLYNRIFFCDKYHGWVFNYPEKQLLFSNDGAETWTINDITIPYGPISDMFFINHENGWAVGENGLILKIEAKDLPIPIKYIASNKQKDGYFNIYCSSNNLLNIEFLSNRMTKSELEIFSLSGRRIFHLSSKHFNPGIQKIVCNTDKFVSGVYLCSLKCGENNWSRTFMILK